MPFTLNQMETIDSKGMTGSNLSFERSTENCVENGPCEKKGGYEEIRI